MAWGRTGAYIPAEGSVAARAIEVIAASPGHEATSQMIRDTLGLGTKSSIAAYLGTALKYDWVTMYRVSAHRSDGCIWGLGKRSPPLDVLLPRDEPDEWPVQRIVKAAEAPMQHKPGPSSVFDLAEAV
jgi:hypothetical protein